MTANRTYPSPAAMAKALGTSRYPLRTHRSCADWSQPVEPRR